MGAIPRARIAAVAAALMLVGAAHAHPRAAQRVPIDAVTAIVDAFRTHRIVALEELHGDARGHEFRLSVIRDARFQAAADDILVEFGNALYQGAIDRFVNGEPIAYADLKKVWQNTTQPHAIWDVPIYEDFFRAVRAINATLPGRERLRVLLGDPPIDWEAIRSAEDRQRFLRDHNRSRYPATILQREVLAKGRKALVIYGAGHLYRQNPQGANLIEHAEKAGGARAFVVVSGSLDVVGVTPESVPIPSVVATKGTSLESQMDVVLYLGPPSGKKPSALSAALCADREYRDMRIARMTLAGRLNAAEALAAACAAAQAKADLSGVWKPIDTASPPPEPPPPPVAGGPSPPPPPPKTLSLTVTQSPTELKVVRELEGGGRTVNQTFIYRFDGTESVNQMGPLVFRTKATWDSDALVLASTVSANDKPIGDLKELYRLVNGELVVESTRTTPAGTFSGRTVHRKQ